jgi:hypothetical protein
VLIIIFFSSVIVVVFSDLPNHHNLSGLSLASLVCSCLQPSWSWSSG